MVWGQAYGDVPSAAAQDPFAVAERDTRAMVSAGWWLGTPPQQRQNLIAGRMLALPDGSWWLFGAWGRWYRWTSADGQWHLCPPPRLTITRMSARPLRQGVPVPPVPPHVVPTGPDLAYDPPPPLGFVDAGIRPEVTSRVRATVESAAALPTPDYPHWWGLFSPAMPSTVPVTWGVTLWCATAPVFDARIDAQLLGLWSSYRARPLPEVDGPRWLTPPPLESLIGLYAGRLRAGRVDTAVVILRTMWAIASALREDSRFQPRADALIAMLGVTLHNPTVDYGALSYGDRAVVQQWLTRCPPSLAPALRVEASAGEHFRNAYYDLATALTPVAGDPSERGYVEPRLIAAALLAADLAVVRQEVSSQVIGWLDPQVSGVMRAMLIQRDHPLRPFWPENDRLPRSLRERMDAAGPAVRNTLLATMYGADLAWCRLGGGIPARPRGFPSSVAILAEIVGPRRATSATSAEPASPAPGIAPLAHQYPSNPGGASRLPSVPMAQEPPTGPPGQAPAWASPSARPPPIPPSRSAPTPPAPPAPPATEAWEGAQPWPAAGVRDAGAGDADTPDLRPDDARPDDAWPDDAWPGAGDAGSPVSPPQATQAWSGAEGLEPDRPKPPPPTEVWPGAGERELGAPAPYGSPPGSGERGVAETGPAPPPTQAWSGAEGLEPDRPKPPPPTEVWPGAGERELGAPAPYGSPPGSGERGVAETGPPPPPTQAWPGGEVPEVDGPVSPPPATQAWPGSGDPVMGDVASRPPATQAWPGTGEREVGGAASPAPVTQAWREAGEQDFAGTPPPSSPAEAEPVEGEPSGTDSPGPAAESRLGTVGDVDPPAWPGSGEGDLSSTGGETPDPGERDLDEELAPPPVTEARAEGLDDGEPSVTRAWTEAELREATEGPPSAGSFSSTGEPEPATSTVPPAAAPVAEATDSDDDSIGHVAVDRRGTHRGAR